MNDRIKEKFHEFVAQELDVVGREVQAELGSGMLFLIKSMKIHGRNSCDILEAISSLCARLCLKCPEAALEISKNIGDLLYEDFTSRISNTPEGSNV
jgi:hypothetical protein